MQIAKTRSWKPAELDKEINDTQNARQLEVWKATHIRGYVAGESAEAAWARRVTQRCKAEVITISASVGFEEWSNHMEERWSEDGYYPMGLMDEENDQYNYEEVVDEDCEELIPAVTTEQMHQYIEETSVYYPTYWESICRMT